MTLLRDIQDAAIGTEVPISTVLRQAQVLAARLNHAPLREWVISELDGYSDQDSLPDYRRLGRIPVLGDFSGGFGSGMKNAPVPPNNVPTELRERLFTHDVYEGVAQLEAMIRSDSGARYPWPAEITAMLASSFYEHQNAMSVSKIVSTTALAGVLDTVRNRLLTFALDIEKLAPEAGDVGPTEASPVSPAAVTQIFNTTIHGGQVSLAAAGQGDVAQNVGQQVTAAETAEDVMEALRSWGIPEEDINELDAALDADRSQSGDLVLGHQTQGWIGRIATRLGTGALSVAEDVSVGTIVALLSTVAASLT